MTRGLFDSETTVLYWKTESASILIEHVVSNNLTFPVKVK